MGNPNQLDLGGVTLVVSDIVIASTPGGAQTDLTAVNLTATAGVTPGTATASKAVILDASKNIATLGTIGAGVITSTGDIVNGVTTITSANAKALAVGLTGATNPAFAVDASTASQVAGLKVVGAAHNGTVALVTTDSSGANNLTINALSTGTIGIGTVSTGAVTIAPATTVTGLLTANGGVTLGTATSLTTAAGTTTVAPVIITAGTNLTSAIAGAVEFDGKAFYLTPTAGARNVNDAEQFTIVGATPVALSNSSTSAQNIFGSGGQVISLAAATSYFFEGELFFATGATTHTTALALTASSAPTSIQYFTQLWSTTSGSISTTAASFLDVAVTTATVLNATSTAPNTIIRVKGIIRTNAATTITPTITFSSGPTGTCQTNTNSYMRFWTVGSNVVQAIGNWA
jgi:hypothetical protein